MRVGQYTHNTPTAKKKYKFFKRCKRRAELVPIILYSVMTSYIVYTVSYFFFFFTLCTMQVFLYVLYVLYVYLTILHCRTVE